MKRVLLIDDIRTASFIALTYGIEVTKVAKDYWQGIEALKTDQWDLLCLDHDLASFDDKGKELTGYDIMKFLEANPKYMPKDFLWVSSNPVGCKNMQACLDSIKNNTYMVLDDYKHYKKGDIISKYEMELDDNLNVILYRLK